MIALGWSCSSILLYISFLYFFSAILLFYSGGLSDQTILLFLFYLLVEFFLMILEKPINMEVNQSVEIRSQYLFVSSSISLSRDLIVSPRLYQIYP